VNSHQGTGTTRYLLDGSSVLEELGATSATTLKYLNNPQQIDEVLAYQRGGATAYPLTDALGSLYASTDASGSVVHRYDFDVYGKRTDLGGSAPAVDVGYTGRWHDPNGLIEYRNRQRNPLLGNWMQPDPAGMIDGPNKYLYVKAQPTIWKDPDGRLVVSPRFVGARIPVYDTWTATAVYHPLVFLALLAALGDISDEAASRGSLTCEEDPDPDRLEYFFRGDSLSRAQTSVTDGFRAAQPPIGAERGQRGPGLYMSRNADVAIAYAGQARDLYGAGALLGIAISSRIWRVVVGMGARDEVPMSRVGTATETFVPIGPAFDLFDAASAKQIIQRY